MKVAPFCPEVPEVVDPKSCADQTTTIDDTEKVYTAEEKASIQNEFRCAAIFVRKNRKKLPKEQFNQAYAFYKQAVIGRCVVAANPKNAKMKAWIALGTMSTTTAMKKYIEIAEGLDPKWKGTLGAGPDNETSWRDDPVAVGAACGSVGLGVAIVVGLILSAIKANKGTPTPRATACMLEAVGANLVVLNKPWEPATNVWFPGMIFVAMFASRRYIFPMIVKKCYHFLPETKRIKISNYLLEIVGTTFGLVICSKQGFWVLLFVPSEYDPMTPEKGHDLAIGLQMLAATFIAMYSLELSFDFNMRLGLSLHHWIALILVLWSLPVVHAVDNDVKMIRCVFAMSLYMSTEQNVFIEMLMYHKKFLLPKTYAFSAWFYAITRLFIAVSSFWTWWEAKDCIFSSGSHNHFAVYALWFFVPIANVILNLTQITTIQSLFGIAASVRKRVEAASQLSGTRNAAMQAFIVLDFDQGGSIDAKEFKDGIKALDLEVVVPNFAFEKLFAAIDIDGSSVIDQTEFLDFFCPFMLPGVEFKRSFVAIVLRFMMTDERITKEQLRMMEGLYDNLIKEMTDQTCGGQAVDAERAEQISCVVNSLNKVC